MTTLSNVGSSVDDMDSRPGGDNNFPDASYSAGSRVTKDASYKMDHKYRGHFTILNNKNFDASTNMAERSGTDVDADSLERLFKYLGFMVYRRNNVKVSEMMSILKDVSRQDHSNMDCLGLAILSHGEDGIIYGTDDFIPIDNLLNPIKNCTSLTGKPKLFFIQACRGSKLDPGTQVEADGGERMIKIPIEADCLYAFSTVPGYYSWRNSLKGSWFIQSLVAVFERDKDHQMDLLSLMTRVNRMVACEFESNSSLASMSRKKQVPYIATTLTKDLFLLPKH